MSSETFTCPNCNGNVHTTGFARIVFIRGPLHRRPAIGCALLAEIGVLVIYLIRKWLGWPQIIDAKIPFIPSVCVAYILPPKRVHWGVHWRGWSRRVCEAPSHGAVQSATRNGCAVTPTLRTREARLRHATKAHCSFSRRPRHCLPWRSSMDQCSAMMA
jgi:hypothetical protein